MQTKPFYDVRTFTVSYVVYDEASKDAGIIDPVLDYDPASSKVWAESIEQLIDFVRSQKLGVHYILETHWVRRAPRSRPTFAADWII